MISNLVFFISVVSLTYGIAAKLGDVLNPVYFQRLASAIREYSFQHAVQNANAQLRVLIDKTFGFRKIGLMYLPRFWKVAFVSLIMSAAIVWPLLSHKTHAPVFDPLNWDLQAAWMFKIPMAVESIFVDYFSFAKSRTILSVADEQSSARSIFAVIALDACASATVAAILWYAPEFMQDYVISVGFPTHVMLAVLVPLKLSAYCAVASGALIVILFAIVALMNYVMLGVSRIDKLKGFSIKFLNFENKPHLAAAALMILGFTAVYWPLAVIVYLIDLV